MSKSSFKGRATIRKRGSGKRETRCEVMFLYGKLEDRKKAVAYCKLHKCFLEKEHIIEKRL